MSLAARLFERLHRARFYEDLHAEAVALVGPGEGRREGGGTGRWLDVGAGPGLVARLAATDGWRATALDPDPAMVARAVGIATRLAEAGEPIFEPRLAGLEDLSRFRSADVVSAASLLMVVPDRAAALDRLLAAVAPGGVCLVVETTAEMTLGGAVSHLVRRGWSDGGWLLLVWAMARGRAEHLTDEDFHRPGWIVTRRDFLDGMVAARLLRRVE